jgi:hypothetical protein
MTFEEAIRARYGSKIPITAEDLKLRKFKIDELRNGFIMKMSGAGVFGSFIDGETYIWTESGVTFHKQEHKENKEIRAEWLIWEIARSMLERGERLNRTDSERLALAVQRLEAWL